MVSVMTDQRRRTAALLDLHSYQGYCPACGQDSSDPRGQECTLCASDHRSAAVDFRMVRAEAGSRFLHWWFKRAVSVVLREYDARWVAVIHPQGQERRDILWCLSVIYGKCEGAWKDKRAGTLVALFPSNVSMALDALLRARDQMTASLVRPASV